MWIGTGIGFVEEGGGVEWKSGDEDGCGGEWTLYLLLVPKVGLWERKPSGKFLFAVGGQVCTLASSRQHKRVMRAAVSA